MKKLCPDCDEPMRLDNWKKNKDDPGEKVWHCECGKREYLENRNVWRYLLRYDPEINEYRHAPVDCMSMSVKLLKQVNFGRGSMTRLDIAHLDTIVFLFETKQEADCFQQGYKIATKILPDPAAFNQASKDEWDELDKG